MTDSNEQPTHTHASEHTCEHACEQHVEPAAEVGQSWRRRRPAWWVRTLAIVLAAVAVVVGLHVGLYLVRASWRGFSDAGAGGAAPFVQPLAMFGLLAHMLLPRAPRWREWRVGLLAGEAAIIVTAAALLLVPAQVTTDTARLLLTGSATAMLTVPTIGLYLLAERHREHREALERSGRG